MYTTLQPESDFAAGGQGAFKKISMKHTNYTDPDIMEYMSCNIPTYCNRDTVEHLEVGILGTGVQFLKNWYTGQH